MRTRANQRREPSQYKSGDLMWAHAPPPGSRRDSGPYREERGLSSPPARAYSLVHAVTGELRVCHVENLKPSLSP